MNRIQGITAIVVVLATMAGANAAEDEGWDTRLAKSVSTRLKEIQTEISTLQPTLAALPDIPIDDQGGTGGYAGIHPRAVPVQGTLHAVEVSWPALAKVDQVALVPARRYTTQGLDAQYGLPDDFSVELIDADGKAIAEVARERHTRSHPIRKGHPFFYQISPPMECAGIRITAARLLPDPEGEGAFVHAWAEVFAFEDGRNIARGSEVKSIGGVTPPAPWHWSPSFLVDGQTPLGLPEVPAAEHRNIGWLSEGRNDPNKPASLVVDLGEKMELDSVRLLPAKRPTSDLPSGFGFPTKLAISISDSGEPNLPESWKPVTASELRNPGHNPVVFPFEPVRGRYVKVEAVQLWKAFESYPAFFALSEVEVLSGDQNKALGRGVRSSDGMLNLIAPGGRYWSGAALSDGYGPEGKLVSVPEWMGLLDKRLVTETQLHDLQAEADEVTAGWRRAGLWVFAILGVAGAFTIIALPIRYRIQANRELLKVRERIAGDLHDEVGSNLGSIQMFADLAEGRAGPSDELKRIQRIAAETVSAVRDIVWLLRPGGDHRIGTVEHLRETSSIMLEMLTWKFHANEDAWQVELPEEDTRHLFLFFREALHNILRHAKASKVDIRVDKTDGHFQIRISDDGVGIDPAKLERPATLRALRQRTTALGAELQVASSPGQGTSLTLIVPITRKRLRKPVPVSSTPA
ncbi:MAG: histidine kinase [Akkermansiaceae bacterium]|nr:histidine kinase [Akkermansiaceae bacterium]